MWCTRYLGRLLWLSPLMAVAATCVTNVDQRAPAGPWVGDVINGGGQAVYGASATARLLDASGREVYPDRIAALACPSKLLPGERGAFELFDTGESYPPASLPLNQATLPMHAEFDATAFENVGTGQARGDGQLVTLLTLDASKTVAHVRLTNNYGSGYFSQFSVCGVLRDPRTQRVVAVGRADGPPLPYVLLPGQSIDLDVRFDVAVDGDLRWYALGLLNAPYEDCCPLGASTWHSVDLRWFSVLLPPGWQYIQGNSIDSFAGTFAGDGMQLYFDYGTLSSPPQYADPAQALTHDESIGGLTGNVFTSSGGDLSGVYFAHVPAYATNSLQPNLVMGGRGLTPDQERVALQVFRSVRFPLRSQ